MRNPRREWTDRNCRKARRIGAGRSATPSLATERQFGVGAHAPLPTVRPARRVRSACIARTMTARHRRRPVRLHQAVARSALRANSHEPRRALICQRVQYLLGVLAEPRRAPRDAPGARRQPVGRARVAEATPQIVVAHLHLKTPGLGSRGSPHCSNRPAVSARRRPWMRCTSTTS